MNRFAQPKTRVLLLLAAIPITFHFCTGPANDQPAAPAVAAVTEESPAARGAKLVHLGGCTDCHSPKMMTPAGPIPDSTKLYSGHPEGSKLPAITYDASKPGNWVLMTADLTAVYGPWGISYAANLTPDSTTGIGNWTAETFIKAMRTGKHMGQDGGRPILPPMPWPTLARLSDAELSAMFAYFKSLPPIKNQVPAPVPPNEVAKMK